MIKTFSNFSLSFAAHNRPRFLTSLRILPINFEALLVSRFCLSEVFVVRPKVEKLKLVSNALWNIPARPFNDENVIGSLEFVSSKRLKLETKILYFFTRTLCLVTKTIRRPSIRLLFVQTLRNCRTWARNCYRCTLYRV